MSEDMAQLQRAVDDILQVKKMRPLSTYNSPSFSALSSSCSPGVTNKESPVESSSVQYQQGSVIKVEEEATMRSPSLPRLPSVVLSTVVTGPSPERSGSAPRALIMPMTRENSPEAQPESENSTRNENTGEPPVGRTNSPNYDPHVMYNTLSTNPMGSLYEVTKLRSLRSNSTTNIHSHPHSHLGVGESGTIARFTGARSNLGRTMSLCIENNDDDLISRGAVSLEEANELFDL